ncbi:hypothetical protein AAE02nite_33710 [Adhaeribacter aerolatus]|uniref:NERD domain-containing protein n=1 Tax=Adhaeribacter aerolatus TaxID=670289 RepID=A0A512B1N3_9BACT|nr:tetratricopeptide repeat protein [Adhaeribacter aerolatus]GEO05707.1 hypothetical protein AAE02nite_33710 [Adhaeribacter aerolatus]
MAFHAFLNNPYNYTHENEIFDVLVEKLSARYRDTNYLSILLGNVNCNGREMDAIAIKKNSITIIDFKNYGGDIKFSENAAWETNDTIIKGGTYLNPLEQLKDNKRIFKQYLEHTSNIFYYKDSAFLPHISGLVLFHKTINFNQAVLPPNIKTWFRIADIDSASDTLYNFSSLRIKLSESEILNFPKALHLEEYRKEKLLYTSRLTNNQELKGNDIEVKHQNIHPDISALISLGNIRFIEGDFYGAIDAYTQATIVNPSESLAYYKRGLCYQSLDENLNAIDDFNQAIAFSRNFSPAFLGRANSFFSLKQYNKAMEDYIRITNDKSKPVKEARSQIHFKLGSIHASNEHYSPALEEFTRSIEYEHSYYEPYFERGRVNLIAGNYKEAVNDFSEYIHSKPNNPEAYFYKGKAKEACGSMEEAINEYSLALKYRPKYSEVLLHRANALVILNKYEEALKDYDLYVLINPNDNLIFVRRGDIKKGLYDYKGAIEDFSKVINVNPSNAAAFFKRGLTQLELKAYKKAIEDFDVAISLNLLKQEVYFKRAEAKLNLEDYEGVIEDYSYIIAAGTRDANVFYKSGLAKQFRLDFSGAIEDFTDAIGLTKSPYNCGDFYASRAFAYKSIGEYTSAISDYLIAIKLSSDKANKLKLSLSDAYLGIAVNENSYGNYENAIINYVEAIKLNPTNNKDLRIALAEVYFNKALINKKEYKPENAFADFSKAIELNHNNPFYYYERSLLRFTFNDYLGAHMDFSIASELEPDDVYYTNQQCCYDTIIEAIELNPGNWACFTEEETIEDIIEEFEIALIESIKAVDHEPIEEDFLHWNNNEYYEFRGYGNYTDSAHFYYRSGDLKVSLQNFKGAIEDYTKAIELDWDVADYYQYRAYASFEVKDYDNAVADYVEAIRLDSTKENELRISLAEVYFKKAIDSLEIGLYTDFDYAIEDYTKAIELNPSNAEYYYHRGLTRCDTKDYKGAAKDFTKAIKLNSIRNEELKRLLPYAYFYNAIAKERNGNYNKAIINYTRAIELNPSDAEYYQNRGCANFEMNNFEAALADYTKAIELDPSKTKQLIPRLVNSYNNMRNFMGSDFVSVD